MKDLPAGFVLDTPEQQLPGLPAGFVLDSNPTVAGDKGEVKSSYFDAAVRGATQGASFGFSDEISALGAAGGGSATLGALRLGAEKLLPSVLGQGGQEAYDARLADQRARIKAAQDQYPVTTFAGTLAGAIAVPVGAGVTGAANLAKLGAGTGAVAGFGSGEGVSDRMQQAATGGVLGGAFGYGVGRVIDRFAAKPLAALPSPAAAAARELDIPLTQGQRTGDVATLSRENAMIGGAYGERAQQIASAAMARQREAILGARDGLVSRAGQGLVDIDRPADAGALVGQVINRVGDDAAARVRATEAADLARIAAQDEAAQGIVNRATQVAGDAINPMAATPVSAASDVIDAVKSRADVARQGVRAAYDDVFQREGMIRPEFFTGLSRGSDVAVPGSPLNDFAEPLSKRITARLASAPEPIIPDVQMTPMASRTLDQLDRVTSLNLGRIGNPVPGQEVAGINLRGIEQARKIITAGMRNVEKGSADQFVLRRIISEFDDELERGMSSILFQGDDAALDGLKAARQAHRVFQQTFRVQGTGDDVGGALVKILERNATPEEVANYTLGSGKLGETGLSVRLFDRLQSILGKDSEELAAIKGAAFSKLIGNDDVASPKAARAVAERITEALNGRGSTLTSRMFTPEERLGLKSYANVLRTFASRSSEKPQPLNVPQPVQLIMDVAAKRLSPEDTANALIGAGGRVNTSNLALIDAVGGIVGRESAEWAAIRQAALLKAMNVTEGRTEMGAQKMSERIYEFVNGSGASLARRLFSPAELDELKNFAAVQKATIPPREATNPSNSGNRIAAMARNAGTTTAAIVGGSAQGPTGAAAGWAFGKALSNFANMRASKEAARLFSATEPQRVVGVGERLASRLSENSRLPAQLQRAIAPYVSPDVPLLAGPRTIAADDEKRSN